MLVVAVAASGTAGALRARVTAVRVRSRRGYRAASTALRTALTAALGMLLGLRGLAGLALVAYGAWLAWPPAGFITAGALLLADRVGEERAARPDEERP